MSESPTPKTITVTVRPDGGTRVETHGYTGPECREASQFLETALGTKATEFIKPGFYIDTVEPEPEQREVPG